METEITRDEAGVPRVEAEAAHDEAGRVCRGGSRVVKRGGGAGSAHDEAGAACLEAGGARDEARGGGVW